MTRWNKRIRNLRRRYRRVGGVLIMPGGRTVVLQTSDWLALVLAAMRREYERMCGRQAPTSKFDRTLDLLERAVEVGPGSPPLLALAWDALQGPHHSMPDEDDPDFISNTIN